MTSTRETRNVNARYILGISESKAIRSPRLVSINGEAVGQAHHPWKGWSIEQTTTRNIDVSDTEWIEIAVWVGGNIVSITLHPQNDGVTVEFELDHDEDNNESDHGSATPLF